MAVAHLIGDISFDNTTLNLMVDGKRISVSLEHVSPKLFAADPVQRGIFRLSQSRYGIHWPMVDEDLSVEALLRQAGF